MKLIYILLVCLIIISTANAVTLVENINISGNGSLYATTENKDNEKDKLSGQLGEHNYTRSLSFGSDGSSSLDTTYQCFFIPRTNSELDKNITNYYYIEGTSPLRTHHQLSIRSRETIESKTTVAYAGEYFETNFNISATNGSLDEMASVKDDQKGSNIAGTIATTNASGNIELTSSMTDSAKEEEDATWYGYKEVDQVGKIDAVQMMDDPRRKMELSVVSGYKPSSGDKAKRLIDAAYTELTKDGGSIDKALYYVNEALDEDNSDEIRYLAYVTQGAIRMRQKYYADAADSFDNALKLNSEDSEVWLSDAKALNASNRTAEAVNVLMKATKKFSDTYSIWLNMALYLRKQGRLDEALTSVRNAINIDPQGEAYLLEGTVYYMKSLVGDCNDCCQMARDAFNNSTANGGDATKVGSYMDKLTASCNGSSNGKPEVVPPGPTIQDESSQIKSQQINTTIGNLTSEIQ